MDEVKKYTIKNYVVFGLVMKKTNIAKKCLDRILNVKIRDLKYIESEKTEKLAPDLHGIRMDVYCENDEAVYNIEMQAYTIDEIGKRSRYYQDVMDMAILGKGKPYSALKKNIVIFICTFDPFDKGRHIYTFENRCIQDHELSLNDESLKIILNTKGVMDDVPKSLRMFLDYIETDVVQDDYTKEIDEAVIEAQNNKRWRERIMREEWLMQDLVKAKEEAENKEKTMKRETAIRMLNRGEFPDDTICEIADITFNELEEIKKNRKSVK